jgi:hypothetical protein
MPATDFDFLPGRRHVHNRKLVDPLDPDASEWIEFDGGASWKSNWVMELSR